MWAAPVESGRRGGRWDERAGTWVWLADGDPWLLPKPAVDTRPGVLAWRNGLGPATSFGPAYDGLLDALETAEGETERARLSFAVAVALLGRNYRLGPDDYRYLLRQRVLADDPSGENAESWREIVRVAIGVGRKTAVRWVRLAHYATTGYAGPMFLEDFYDLLGFGVDLGRVVPARKWAEDLQDEDTDRAWDAVIP